MTMAKGLTKKVINNLTRDELNDVLKAFNNIKDVLMNAKEYNDIFLSDLTKLDEAREIIGHSLNFRPKALGENNKPNFYSDYVLADDDRAWHYAKND